MRFLPRRTSDAPIDPGTPHAFRRIDDAGLGAYAVGAGATTT